MFAKYSHNLDLLFDGARGISLNLVTECGGMLTIATDTQDPQNPGLGWWFSCGPDNQTHPDNASGEINDQGDVDSVMKFYGL